MKNVNQISTDCGRIQWNWQHIVIMMNLCLDTPELTANYNLSRACSAMEVIFHEKVTK